MSIYKHTITNLDIENVAKLVRDKVPAEILQEEGIVVRTEILDDVEYEAELCKKAIEEATEFASARTDENILEDAADMLEVIRSRIALHGLTIDDVEEVRLQKIQKRGGFNDRIFMYPKGL